MCTRTRTAYGCGHVYKRTDDCYSSACTGVERRHDHKSWGCHECKSQCASSSKGREDKEPHIQQTNKPRRRQCLEIKLHDKLSDTYEVGGGAGPWATPTGQEKTWESPHRKQADGAWLTEHDDRISDLTSRLEKARVADETFRSAYPRVLAIPNSDHSDFDSYEQDDFLYGDDIPSRNLVPRSLTQRPSSKIVQAHSHKHQDRQHSYDSLPDSLPSYRSSPRPRQGSNFAAVNAYPEASQECDYYASSHYKAPSKHHHHRHGHKRYNHEPQAPKSEVYYSPRTQFHKLDYDIISAPPPMHIPPPNVAAYESYEFCSSGGSPPAPVFTYSAPPYSAASLPPPAIVPPPPYVSYRPYLT